MKYNTGFVFLQKGKRMRCRIKVHWILKYIITLLYACAIFAVSSEDTSSVPMPPHIDKLIHLGVFSILCSLICWSLSSVQIGKKSIYKIILAIVITSLYAGSDEFHQLFTPHRSVEVLDWAADTVGALVALFLWYLFLNKRQTREAVSTLKHNTK